MNSRNKPHNVIWLELENHRGEDRDAKNEAAAEQANKMLAKLGVHHGYFEWMRSSKHGPHYIWVEAQSGSYTSLVDDGHFFNLDYLAK